ncbi:MAG: S9 family peptidase, partial [Bacteroidetes bacterium 4572_114]
MVKYNTKSGDKSILVAAADLVPEGEENPLSISNYQWSENRQMLLVFTNTRRVWRYNTRGDYWVLDLETKELKQLGEGLPGSSLMFAKFSPDNSKVAYVSKHNLYVEDLASGEIDQLTFDGTEDLINGTFDWAYEEEFFCRDGFRWSPNSKLIAYWQIDASGIKDFLMINNTDSLYSFTIPVEYPKVGEDPSSARIGVVATNGGNTKWMNIPGDPQQNYLVRMLWADNSKDFLVQQMNRKQNTNKIWFCKAETGLAANVYTDRDEAWLDLVEDWMWVDGEKYYTWLSENDGWRHLYLISKTGDEVKLITPGNYDVISIGEIDKKSGDVYFIASPHNPTQRYL